MTESSERPAMTESSERTSSAPIAVVAAMAALGTVGLLVGFLVGLVTFSLVGAPLSLSPESLSGQLVFSLGTYLGVAAVGVLYMIRHELPFSYVRLDVPSLRDLLWTAATVLALLVLAVAIPTVIDRLGLPFTDHSIADTIAADPAIALVFIPLSLLVVGPAEEFLYRGVIQTRLADVFDTGWAIGIAAVVFAVVHILAYLDPSNLAGTLVTVFAILLPLGAILGVVYEYTGNLFVPALAHGLYNAITFGLTYLDTVGSL